MIAKESHAAENSRTLIGYQGEVFQSNCDS